MLFCTFLNPKNSLLNPSGPLSRKTLTSFFHSFPSHFPPKSPLNPLSLKPKKISRLTSSAHSSLTTPITHNFSCFLSQTNILYSNFHPTLLQRFSHSPFCSLEPSQKAKNNHKKEIKEMTSRMRTCVLSPTKLPRRALKTLKTQSLDKRKKNPL